MPEGEEIDCPLLWKKAHGNKDGEIDKEVAPIITEIVSLCVLTEIGLMLTEIRSCYRPD